jgi:hypothetical protein
MQELRRIQRTYLGKSCAESREPTYARAAPNPEERAALAGLAGKSCAESRAAVAG